MNRVLLQTAIIGGYCFSKREEDYISSEPYVGLGVKHDSLRRADGLSELPICSYRGRRRTGKESL